jgi:hypothetical protein
MGSARTIFSKVAYVNRKGLFVVFWVQKVLLELRNINLDFIIKIRTAISYLIIL